MIKHPLMNHFWEGVRSGKFIPLPDSTVSEIISSIFLSATPIVELDNLDYRVIRKSLENVVGYTLNRGLLKIIAEQEIFYFEPGEKVGTRHNFSVSPYDGRFGNIGQRKELTIEQKLTLFSNLEIWHNGRINDKSGSGPLPRQGMRHLTQEKSIDNYGFTERDFLETIDRIKERTKKDSVNILDVGGASGIALTDAK